MAEVASTTKQDLFLNYILHLADTNVILGQRLAEWCGHGPILEQDIAMSNIGLDLIGQTRNYYQYAAELQGEGKTEDDLAFLRDEREFYNLLIVEQKNGNFGDTVARQFFYDVYHFYLLQELVKNSDATLAAIAEKSLKEVTYHLKWSSEWMIRLGDGTDESHAKIQKAIDDIGMFTGEMFLPTDNEKELIKVGIIPDLLAIQKLWKAKVQEVVDEAGLTFNAEDHWVQKGGKDGKHTELLGHILAEMQYLQRSYPGLKW